MREIYVGDSFYHPERPERIMTVAAIVTLGVSTLLYGVHVDPALGGECSLNRIIGIGYKEIAREVGLDLEAPLHWYDCKDEFVMLSDELAVEWKIREEIGL